MTSIQCIIKQFLDSVFVISTIIKVLVRVISQSRKAEADNPYRDLIILDITKTSSNNRLLSRKTLSKKLYMYIFDMLGCLLLTPLYKNLEKRKHFFIPRAVSQKRSR